MYSCTRACMVTEWGGPEVLQDLAILEPQANQVGTLSY